MLIEVWGHGGRQQGGAKSKADKCCAYAVGWDISIKEAHVRYMQHTNMEESLLELLCRLQPS